MKEWAEGILPHERDLFFALNGSDSTFWDNAMWAFTGRFIWLPIMLLILFLFFYKTPRKEAFWALLFFILLFIVCDQVSSSIFKPLFQRFRPTHHPDFENLVDIVNGYRGGQYGFISGHATNSFGVAVFLSLLYRYRWLTLSLIFWALINSYSRVYLGVHFVSDIIAGALIGSLIAFALYELYACTRYKFYAIPAVEKRTPIYPAKHARILGIAIFFYIIFIAIFSHFLTTLPH